MKSSVPDGRLKMVEGCGESNWRCQCHVWPKPMKKRIEHLKEQSTHAAILPNQPLDGKMNFGLRTAMAIVMERFNSLMKSWFQLSWANRGMDGVRYTYGPKPVHISRASHPSAHHQPTIDRTSDAFLRVATICSYVHARTASIHLAKEGLEYWHPRDQNRVAALWSLGTLAGKFSRLRCCTTIGDWMMLTPCMQQGCMLI